MRPIWIDLKIGKLSEDEAIKLYHSNFNIPIPDLTKLMLEIKTHQQPLPGRIELLSKLKTLGLNLFALTDNVREIIEYHKTESEFPKYFTDITSSCDIGVLKPDSDIYLHLLSKHSLNPAESAFIDDIAGNVEGAIKVGINAFQFIDYPSCEQELMRLLS
jgi:putative hydrolase of the HAD superfamily